MTKRLISVNYDTPIVEAMKLMLQHKIAHVLVAKADSFIGILSERDLLNMLPATLDEIGKRTSGSVMSTSPAIVTPETKIRDVAKVMLSRKARLILVSEKPVGLITATDLAYSLPFTDGNHPSLKSAMTPRVESLDFTESLETAIRIMKAKRIGSIIVKRNFKPYGIFTERDLLAALITFAPKLTRGIGEFCSAPIITATTKETVQRAADIMKANKIKRLPLTEGDEIVGVVTARDIVEAYTGTLSRQS
jgi:CBS domain-containing protein